MRPKQNIFKQNIRCDVLRGQIDRRTLLFLLNNITVCVSYKASNGQETELWQRNHQLAEYGAGKSKQLFAIACKVHTKCKTTGPVKIVSCS